MEVYKFGGASVKDVASLQNVCRIVAQHQGKLIVVVSAMGKTTNRFEQLIEAYFGGQDYTPILEEITNFHFDVLKELKFEEQQEALIRTRLQKQVDLLRDKLGYRPFHSFDFHYDQLICFGELFSSVLLSGTLAAMGTANTWLDVRELLVTDKTYRFAQVNWAESRKNYDAKFDATQGVTVTQGFISGTLEGHTTTLGRDGSDYSASILAFLGKASTVTVWKDVQGVYNADPRWYPNTQKLEVISYKEAIELAFFGAQVIHPKTIKPLQNLQIPFYVKSFLAPSQPGTFVGNTNFKTELPPVYIRKTDQVLLSIQPLDFSFVMEQNMSKIFACFAHLGIKVNLMQNAAISFSACFDYNEARLTAVLKELGQEFDVRYNTGLELITIRHYTKEAIEEMTVGRTVFIQQKSRKTARFVLK